MNNAEIMQCENCVCEEVAFLAVLTCGLLSAAASAHRYAANASGATPAALLLPPPVSSQPTAAIKLAAVEEEEEEKEEVLVAAFWSLSCRTPCSGNTRTLFEKSGGEWG